MAEVALKIRVQKWRLPAIKAACRVLVAVEWLLPGSIDFDVWSERLARFFVAGIRI